MAEENEERKPLMDSVNKSYNAVEDEVKFNSANGSGPASARTTSYSGSTVSFHNLFYEVDVKVPGCCKGKESKTIIKNVSGIFKPGTMNAIMGPTGSGKSSLLDILAARKDPSGLTGTVLINGHPQPSNFRLMSGYVVQDDVVMGTLSVRENLRFSADLRLPDHVSSEERAANVERVIRELGLEKCADTRCGDEFTRGVSGGERKRVNVGMELITAPGVLFLDEPTTGLDASTANSVMLLLKRLALAGSTIIFSIHQPRYSIFKQCDSLILLGNGETIFHGPAKEGLAFFESIGYEIEDHDNPADFFLDAILGDNVPVNNQSTEQAQDAVEKTSVGNASVNGGAKNSGPLSGLSGVNNSSSVIVAVPEANVEDRANRITEISSYLAEQFTQSAWGQRIEEELAPLTQFLENSGEQMESKESFSQLNYHTNPCRQFGVVCGRTIKNLLRNPRTSTLQLITLAFFGTITGAIYFQVADDCSSGIQNRAGVFFFTVMNMVFGNLSAIDLFINERKIFIHENISGFYRVSAYFFAKLLCDVIPNRGVPVIIFSCIVYWMVGLVAKWQNFLFFILNMVLTSLAGSSIAFLASATTRTAAIANLLCALSFVFMMIFSGLLVNLKSLGKWISWAKYISFFSYSMNALTINEFKDVNFYTNTTDPKTNQTIHVNCVKGPGGYLDKQGLSCTTPWCLWQNELALAGISLFLLILTYIQLRRIQKLK